MPLLLILFIAVPIAEIMLFIQAGEIIGFWWTVASIIITAFIGTALVRHQGLAALTRVQSAIQENRMPLEEVFTGICLLLAGALLLTPGFLTDAVGFCLLIPSFRAFIGLGVWRFLKNHSRFQMHMGAGPNHSGYRSENPDTIIDADYKIIDPQQEEQPTKTKSLPPEEGSK